MITRIMRITALAVLVPTLVLAQARDEERRGARAGSFRIQPTLATGVEYQSNVYVEDTNTDSSIITTVSPEVDIVSDWNRHALRLSLGAEYGAYSVSDDDNYFDYNAELAGVIDISRAMRLTATLGYDHGHESRGSDDIAATLLATEPVQTDTFSLNLLGEAAFGRFTVSPFGNFAYLNFDDVSFQGGGTQNNDDRDRTRLELGAELEYAVLSGYSVFVEPAYLRNDYSSAVDDTGVNRDSDGFRVLAGAKVDLTRVIEASIGIGYSSFNYDDPVLQNFSGLAVEIGGDWAITPRTGLNFDISRAVTETTIAGASNGIESAVSLAATYELLRTVTLNTNLGYTLIEYDGAAREDNLFSLGFGVDWRVTRDLTLSPSYAFRMRESNVNGLDYQNHLIGADATYRF